MSFVNPPLKSPVWKFLHHICHGTARWHGRCDAYNTFVLFSQFYQRVPEDILIELRLIQLVYNDTLSCFLVETTRSMPFRSRFLSRLETFAFLGLDMQELWPLYVFKVV